MFLHHHLDLTNTIIYFLPNPSMTTILLYHVGVANRGCSVRIGRDTAKVCMFPILTITTLGPPTHTNHHF